MPGWTYGKFLVHTRLNVFFGRVGVMRIVKIEGERSGRKRDGKRKGVREGMESRATKGPNPRKPKLLAR